MCKADFSVHRKRRGVNIKRRTAGVDEKTECKPLVDGKVWDLEAGGSIPLTPTKHNGRQVIWGWHRSYKPDRAEFDPLGAYHLNVSARRPKRRSAHLARAGESGTLSSSRVASGRHLVLQTGVDGFDPPTRHHPPAAGSRRLVYETGTW